mgnify:CR=1 FL=1
MCQFLFFYINIVFLPNYTFIVFANDVSSAAISGFPSTFISSSASTPSGTVIVLLPSSCSFICGLRLSCPYICTYSSINSFTVVHCGTSNFPIDCLYSISFFAFPSLSAWQRFQMLYVLPHYHPKFYIPQNTSFPGA